MGRTPASASGRNGDGKGPLWKFPVVRTKELGKLGPGFGFGVGCGVGFGIGLFGGAGLGAGFPGLKLGFGVGAGCGIGLGFGYGVGKGVAYDENRKYTNIGNLMGNTKSVPTGEQITALLDDLAVFTEKQITFARKQIEESASRLEKKFRSGGY